jgi:hypothetical protein
VKYGVLFEVRTELEYCSDEVRPADVVATCGLWSNSGLG